MLGYFTFSGEAVALAALLWKFGRGASERGPAGRGASSTSPNGLTLGVLALVGVLLLILAIGWSRCYDPFVGDQALFLIGAEKLHAGGVLYRDFWDIKQPGIFAFFLVGGLIFGFNQIGEHVADLAWQLGFAGALVLGLRGCFTRPAVARAFAPIAVVGAYYAGSSAWHLLQVEELVGFPLFCCAWLLVESLKKSSKRLAVASGVFGGIVLAFKLVFVVLLFGVVIAVVVAMRATVSRDRVRSTLAGWLVGVALPVALVAGYAVLHSSETITLKTTFVIPIEVLFSADMHAPAARLADSTMRFLLYFRGLILLGLVGAVAVDRSRREANVWRLVCISWIVCDLVAIAIQISSWWQYHFLLLIPPVGILAALGLDFIVRNGLVSWKRAFVSLAMAGIIAYVAVPLPQGALGTLLLVGKERPFESAASLERYRIGENSEYADALDDSAIVRHRATGATVYVFGDPLIYVDTDAAQAIAMNSWAIQLFTPALWRQTVSELCQTRPRYIFVFDRFLGRLQTGDRGAAMSLLSRDYVRSNRTRHGEWYELRTATYDARICGSAVARQGRNGSRVPASRSSRDGHGGGDVLGGFELPAPKVASVRM